MIYETIQPCSLLKDYISHFWIGSWDAQSRNSTHYIIASSLAEITFAFNNTEKHSELLFTSIQGQTDKPNQHSVAQFGHLLGVSFYAHSLPFLFNIPATELNHEYLSLDVFLGQDARILSEKIALANSNRKRIEILTAYFIARLRKQHLKEDPILNAITEIRKNSGSSKIAALANDFCFSHKQFSRKFKAYTGFSPKLFSRIIRFESSIINYPNTNSLTDLAYLNDYYDQAHFIHDFKSFSGFSPKDFWKLSGE